jgi:acetolactate synthase-1/2/3 large subunit
MLVVGSRLRGNETRNNQMPLPRPLLQIDADASQGGRNYPVDLFVHGDAADTLRRLLDRCRRNSTPTRISPSTLPAPGREAEGQMRAQLGPYRVVADAISAVAAGGHAWVRDVTISNSTFGNRYVRLSVRTGRARAGRRDRTGRRDGRWRGAGLHGRQGVTLLGDGGTMLGLAEMITAVDENGRRWSMC